MKKDIKKLLALLLFGAAALGGCSIDNRYHRGRHDDRNHYDRHDQRNYGHDRDYDRRYNN